MKPTIRNGALRVAVVGTNDPRNVSGGRYHALMLCYACGSLGWDTHLITDHTPSFLSDIDPLAPDRVVIHQTNDFQKNLPEKEFDWVIVVPTGIFLPNFYESCLDFAASANARVALLNFESANWFNTLAPEPRDPTLWDYWRRLLVRGGLVLSSARTSDRWARAYYNSAEAPIRFEVWQPPVNSAAAQRFDDIEKDGSIVVFVRPQDTHKGADLLNEIDPELFSGRLLHLISGRDLPRSFRDKITARFYGESRDAQVAFHYRVSDIHKFRLLSAAQTVLFPTSFEGYGYPPIEAAFAGTECVCFDLEVLKETVGAIAHFASAGSLAEFQTATSLALRAPERRRELRQAVFPHADFKYSAKRLGDILLRSLSNVAPIPTRSFRVSIGPFHKSPPRPSREVSRDAPLAPFPPYIVNALTTTGGDVLISGRAHFPRDARLAATVVDSRLRLPVWARHDGAGTDHLQDTAFFVLAPKEVIGRRIKLAAATPLYFDPIEMEVERVAPNSPLAAVFGLSENVVAGDERKIRAWVLARERITAVALTIDGSSWSYLPVIGRRQDVATKYPSYGTEICEFKAHFSEAAEPNKDAIIFCMAMGGTNEYATDVLSGWPPSTKPYFGEVDMASQHEKEIANDTRKSRSGSTSTPLPYSRAQVGEVDILSRTDKKWNNGICRTGSREQLGIILVSKSKDYETVGVGKVLRFGSGTARRICGVTSAEDCLVVTLNGPIASSEVHGSKTILLLASEAAEAKEGVFTIHDWSDMRWRRGVWNGAGQRYRHGFAIKTQLARQNGIVEGAQLRFASSGTRTVVAVDGNEKDTRVWLDGIIRPLADGAPNPVRVRSVAMGGDPLLIVAPKSGDNDAGLPEDCVSVRTVVVATSDQTVRPGDLLRSSNGSCARVLYAAQSAAGQQLVLDHQIEPNSGLARIEECEKPDGHAANHLFPHCDLPAKDSLFRLLSFQAFARGSALLTPAPIPSVQRRILVLSSVSPFPSNQGNRVVTRNLIRHLISIGYYCDVVVQNWMDPLLAIEEFGSTVRFFVTAYPDWQDSISAKSRSIISAAAADLKVIPSEQIIGDEIELQAQNFHPFFIVRDETVDLAKMLYSQHQYDAIVCNYTHMARVAAELKPFRPLPTTVIITHDALSQLPRSYEGKKLDLGCRACTPLLEKEALDVVHPAIVVAISRNEAEYFRRIGVENQVVVVEYDAYEEMQDYVVQSSAFESKIIIFHGSNNPMNVAGMNWFIDECWYAILSEVPKARLLICGNIATSWSPQIDGVEIVGELSRKDLLSTMKSASIAINPCVAGTGLKIKTVETACLGLPSVCLPKAVEGLEDVADDFAIVASDAQGFVSACTALLTDAERWTKYHVGAGEVAAKRFSSNFVYNELDDAAGWLEPSARAVSPFLARTQLNDDAEDDKLIARLELDPHDDAAQLALGITLARSGRADVGWPMVEKVVTSRRGDWTVLRKASALGIELDEPWRAAVYASALIAQRPTYAEGYLLFARATLALKWRDDAVAALEQGLLACPAQTALKSLLTEILRAEDGPGVSERWRAVGAESPEFGTYVAFGPRHMTSGIRGFEIDRHGMMTLRSGVGIILLTAPAGNPGAISLALDFARPSETTKNVEVTIDLEGTNSRCVVRADGPKVQTLTLHAPGSIFDTGLAQLTISLETQLPSPLRLIGYILQAAHNTAAERDSIKRRKEQNLQ